MNSLPAAAKHSVSWLRLTCDLLFAICFLATLTAATADLILGQVFAAAGAIAATIAFGWAGRGMLTHLERWTANWDD